MSPLSAIFICTGAFGAKTLEVLAKDKNFSIPFVITGEDKASGRKMEIQSSVIKEAAIKNKLIVHQAGKIDDLRQKIAHAKPDFLLIVSYGEIIGREILDIPQFGAINVHGSLLPKYRGASPIQEAILHGDRETGITWILMNERMDEGDIIATRNVAIAPSDTYETLSAKLSEFAANHTGRVLENFAKNRKHEKQDSSQSTYCRKIEKEDALISFHKETALQIERKVRAYFPWPGCYFFWNGKRLKVIRAELSEQKISSGAVAIGSDGSILIGTKEGALTLLQVQPESKKTMTAQEFIRGQREIPKTLD